MVMFACTEQFIGTLLGLFSC